MTIYSKCVLGVVAISAAAMSMQGCATTAERNLDAKMADEGTVRNRLALQTCI